MDDETKLANSELDDYISIIRRQKWHFIFPFMLVLAACMALAKLLPPVYSSQATILAKQETVPTDLVETTVTGYVQERIDLIMQRVLTSDNLSKIARENTLYSKEILALSPIKVASTMREAIGIDVVELDSGARKRNSSSRSVLLEVSFESSRSDLARKGAQKLADLILNENAQMRVSQAEGVVMFLEKESNKILSELVSLEERLAQLKQDKHAQMPEQVAINRQRLTKAEIQLERVYEEMLALKNEKMKVQAELSLTNRYSGENDTPEQRLNKARIEYTEARQKYSYKHPDVIRLKYIVKSLQSETFSDERSGLSTKDAGSIGNPEYVRIITLLDTLKINIASQHQKKLALQKKIKEYEESTLLIPQVELLHTSIMREYENVNREFLSIKDKQLQARLAMALEKDQKASAFSLIEKPTESVKPIKPNRLGIVLLGFMLACGAGLAFAVISEVFDRTIRGAKALSDVTNAPPISVIPYFNVDEKALRLRNTELRNVS